MKFNKFIFAGLICLASLAVAQEARDKALEPEQKDLPAETKPWDRVVDKKIWDAATQEGGEVSFYYLNDQLQKIVAMYLGEMNRTDIEYHLINEKLSFVFQKEYKYNRPDYWDSIYMVQNRDNEVFDIEKSKITEKRIYFDDDKIMYQQVNGEETQLLSGEEKKIIARFDKLIGMLK